MKLYGLKQLMADKNLCLEHMCTSQNRVTQQYMQQFSFYELQLYKEMNANMEEQKDIIADHFSSYANSIQKSNSAIAQCLKENQVCLLAL